ncbi:hypothetical protein [Pelagibacterium montanilacus]|uniref:hypothetical protein n=1 Tax=Pelagibacterium montanilacus TaxID=2185280 RepID=UPI000F8C6114|nr:hypothetical protein [Pelagibacterium montanilacus]
MANKSCNLTKRFGERFINARWWQVREGIHETAIKPTWSCNGVMVMESRLITCTTNLWSYP